MQAAKELLKILKNFNKILIYPTNEQNKWWEAIGFEITLAIILKA